MSNSETIVLENEVTAYRKALDRDEMMSKWRRWREQNKKPEKAKNQPNSA